MKSDFVSVIVPIYNCRDYIANTIRSIMNQSFSNYEVLLIDDESTDGSVEIIRELIKDDDRFRLLYLDENQGAATSRNKGIEEAVGEYIAFLDSDDIWHNDKLEKQIAFMQDNDYDFTFTAYRKFGETITDDNDVVKAYDRLDYNRMLKANFIGCSTVMYNQKKLGKVYMPLMRKRQDYGLWLVLLKITPYAYGIDEPLTDYLVRIGSISSNKLEMIKYNWYLFKYVEGFGYIRAAICICNNVFYKLFVKR